MKARNVCRDGHLLNMFALRSAKAEIFLSSHLSQLRGISDSTSTALSNAGLRYAQGHDEEACVAVPDTSKSQCLHISSARLGFLCAQARGNGIVSTSYRGRPSRRNNVGHCMGVSCKAKDKPRAVGYFEYEMFLLARGTASF
jgi:hypothetical protein